MTIRLSLRLLHYTTLLVAVVIILIPFYWLVLTSLRPESLMFQIPASFAFRDLTIKNYVSALNNSNVVAWLGNSLLLSFVIDLIVITIAGLAGYGFARFPFKGSRMLLLGILGSQMFPGILLAIPVFQIAGWLGLLDSYTALVLVTVSLQLPVGIWLFRSFFLSIPRELDEAALVDGCTPVSAFLRIIFPLTAPGIAAVGLFSFVGSWNEYLLPLIILTTPEKWTYPLGLASFVGYYGTDYGGILASSVLATLPMVVAYLVFQRRLVAGLTAGSVKG
ncbi:MAG TPA: carbohydrate ABC transporter permease [Chloroflexota bacterium]|nr:carbohydrate ABC transporter permease [Chloroflexota bacterium]